MLRETFSASSFISIYREAPSVKSNTSFGRCARFARNLCCCTCSHVWLEPLKEWKKRKKKREVSDCEKKSLVLFLTFIRDIGQEF